MHFEISQKTCQHCSLMGWVMDTQAASTSGMLLQHDPRPETDLPLCHLKSHTLNVWGKCVFSSALSHTGTLNTAQYVKKHYHISEGLSYQASLLNIDGGSEQWISLYPIWVEQELLLTDLELRTPSRGKNTTGMSEVTASGITSVHQYIAMMMMIYAHLASCNKMEDTFKHRKLLLMIRNTLVALIRGSNTPLSVA